jgi:hypothetical protein
MNGFCPHLRTAALALAAAMASPANATVLAQAPSVPSYVHTIAADCTAIGQSVASSAGGQLRRAVSVDQGGRTVCVITYTIPSKDGKPPRRVQTTVNAG